MEIGKRDRRTRLESSKGIFDAAQAVTAPLVVRQLGGFSLWIPQVLACSSC